MMMEFPGRQARERPSCSKNGYKDVRRNPKADSVVRKGGSGGTVTMATNFVRVNLKKGKGMFEYRVEFDPPTEVFNLKRRALRQCTLLQTTPYNFDGQTLYVPTVLSLQPIQVPDPKDPKLKMGLTFMYIKPTRLTDSAQFYNVLMKNVQRALGRFDMQGNFYDVRPARRIHEHKLEILAGVTTRIDRVQGGLMMCLDLCHKIIRSDTALDHWNQLKMDGRPRAEERYKEFMSGQMVLANYGPHKVYRVDDVEFEANPLSTFERFGQQTSYVQYYDDQYGLNIADHTQPLLICKQKPRRCDKPGELRAIALIPELCRISGLSDEQATNYSLMKKLGDCTRKGPQERAEILTDFVRTIKACPEAKKILDDWGLNFEEELVRVQGRTMGSPHLEFHGGRIISAEDDFSAEVKNNQCFRPVGIYRFAVFCIDKDHDKAEKFIVSYKEVCQPSGISFVRHGGQVVRVRGSNPNDFRRAIADFMDIVQFIVAIVPSDRAEVYSAIKRFCHVEKALPCQVIRSRTLDNGRARHSVIEKVALQINCKLGGALWALHLPHRTRIMFVGMDVYHDPGRKKPSVLGFVASMDSHCTRYFSLTMSQKPHQEVAPSLFPIFVAALEQYGDVNSGSFPDHIIVFRDGVSDGQWEHLQHTEIQQMKLAIDEVCRGTVSTFCVVQKRINERIFSLNGPMFENPLPGTILDHTITRPHVYDYDFYLASQSVRQGTVSPTHYIVLEDTAGMAPYEMQRYAYHTTFMYYNWFGTISVPAMCKYAHTLAHQSGQYLNTEANRDLCHQLYFI